MGNKLKEIRKMELGSNFNEVSGQKAPVYLPAGTWECKCVKAEWKKSSKGTVYLQLKWQDQEGRTTIEQKFLTEGTTPYFKGWSEFSMNVVFDGTKLNEQLYVGRYGKVTVKKDYYNGEERLKSESSKSQFFQHNKQVYASLGADDMKLSELKAEEHSSSPVDLDDVPF